MPKQYVVAVYETDRAYGGPEEGGWWYTVGELVDIDMVTESEDLAWARIRLLNDSYRHRRDGISWRGDQEARLVELPRRELNEWAAKEACHSDYDFQEDDYETHWDIPVSFPEHAPHYC